MSKLFFEYRFSIILKTGFSRDATNVINVISSIIKVVFDKPQGQAINLMEGRKNN